MQKALAQTTVGRLPPVCFSFGWVAYSFTTLVGVIGDGRLLPPPDFPVKVINLESSYARENKNWIIGRILRDNELAMNKKSRLNGAAVRISIYAVDPGKKRRIWTSFAAELMWGLVTVVQLGIASIPFILDKEWGVFLVTVTGVIAVIVAGKLPQWDVEKLPLKRKSAKYLALTSGNGSREIMVIYGGGNAIDLEELAAGESPRSDRVWESSAVFSAPQFEHGKPLRHGNGKQVRRTYMYKGLPVGLWCTRAICFAQVIFWIALLISVAGLRSRTWYLVAVGGLGMLQNAVIAAIPRPPELRGLPLDLRDTIITRRTMDGLMDLEWTINGAGEALLGEFFPGGKLYPLFSISRCLTLL